MGVPDVQNPVLGETYVELNEMQVKLWDDAKKEDVVTVVVTGQRKNDSAHTRND